MGSLNSKPTKRLKEVNECVLCKDSIKGMVNIESINLENKSFIQVNGEEMNCAFVINMTGCRSDVFECYMYCDEDGLLHYREEDNKSEEEPHLCKYQIQISYNGVCIGGFHANLKDIQYHADNNTGVYPALDFKIMMLQQDGCGKLYSMKLISPFSCQQGGVEVLANIPLRFHEDNDPAFSEMAIMNFSFDIQPKYSASYEQGSVSDHVGSGKYYFPEFHMFDTPFKIYANRKDRMVLCPSFAIQESIFPRSLITAANRSLFDASRYWCFALVKYYMKLLDIQYINLHADIIGNNDLSQWIKNEFNRKRWNYMMSSIILGITAYVYTTFRYSEDRYERVVKENGKDEYIFNDCERFSLGCLYNEGVGDCEEFNQLCCRLYSMINEKLSLLLNDKKMLELLNEGDKELLELSSLMMDKYIACTCVCYTSKLSYKEVVNEDDHVYHMGAVVIPKFYIQNKIYKCSQRVDEVFTVNDIKLEPLDVFDPPVEDLGLTPFIMESTALIYPDISVQLFKDGVTDKEIEPFLSQPEDGAVIMPQFPNIYDHVRHVIYERILNLNIDSFIENGGVPATNFFVLNGDKPYISFHELFDDCKRDDPSKSKVKFYTRCMIPKDVDRRCLDIWMSNHRQVCLKMDYEKCRNGINDRKPVRSPLLIKYSGNEGDVVFPYAHSDSPLDLTKLVIVNCDAPSDKFPDLTQGGP